MITISGVDVIRDNHSFPTLYDAGYSLSQLPRFNGYTKQRYTVLHHLVGCWQYAHDKEYGNKVALYALIHDIHESVTGDICPPWKTEDTRELQDQLDQRFFQQYRLRPPDGYTARIVKAIDNQMVYAEAKAFAPQVAAHILKPGPNHREGIYTLDQEADNAVQYAVAILAGHTYNPHLCGLYFEELVASAILDANEERKEHAGQVQGSV